MNSVEVGASALRRSIGKAKQSSAATFCFKCREGSGPPSNLSDVMRDRGSLQHTFWVPICTHVPKVAETYMDGPAWFAASRRSSVVGLIGHISLSNGRFRKHVTEKAISVVATFKHDKVMNE